MTEPIDESILEKIRKVQGYMKSDNPNEAAVAAAKLTEMLIKHNIDLSQIPTTERVRDPFVMHDIKTDNRQRIPEWKVTIGFTVAKSNLCRMILSYDGREMHWLGRESNVEVAKFIYDTCTRDLQYMADNLWLAIKAALAATGETTIHGRTWKVDFLDGAAVGVQKKLREEMAKWRGDNTEVNALIVLNDKEVDTYVRSMFPSLGSHSGKNVRSSNAYGLGVIAGQNITFKSGVGHGGSTGPKQIKG